MHRLFDEGALLRFVQVVDSAGELDSRGRGPAVPGNLFTRDGAMTLGEYRSAWLASPGLAMAGPGGAGLSSTGPSSSGAASPPPGRGGRG